jgi:5-methylcytosine-specific restriction endonuclease McrA
MFADKVKVLKYSDKIIQGVEKVFRAPAVLVLIKVVRSVYRGRVPFSKKNILVRDRFTCAYCGKMGKSLTIDHVIPLKLRSNLRMNKPTGDRGASANDLVTDHSPDQGLCNSPILEG